MNSCLNFGKLAVRKVIKNMYHQISTRFRTNYNYFISWNYNWWSLAWFVQPFYPGNMQPQPHGDQVQPGVGYPDAMMPQYQDPNYHPMPGYMPGGYRTSYIYIPVIWSIAILYIFLLYDLLQYYIYSCYIISYNLMQYHTYVYASKTLLSKLQYKLNFGYFCGKQNLIF